MEFKANVSSKVLFVTLALVLFSIWTSSAQVFLAEENGEATTIASEDETTSEAEAIVWESEIDVAIEKAKSSDKLVLVDVFKDRCGWCQALDQKVFKNPKIVNFINQNFVCLKSNAEVGEGRKVVRYFEVYSFPTTLVLNSKGKKVGKIVGFMPPKKFNKKLSKILKKAK